VRAIPRPEAVLAAWEACFEPDPASEEVAAALVGAYFAHGHRELAVRVYERCRAALAELGLGLSRMMGLPPGAALGRMSPGELQRETFAAWRSLVSRLVATAPAVLVLEDLHWADPTSLRLTLDLARLAPGRRLLVLATSRPDADPKSPEIAALERAGPSGRAISLGPLPEEDERELAR
jgi:Bacterial transcriptional activator domain